jgi:adenosylcobyric acid synthase
MKLHGHLMVQGCTSDAGKSIMVAALGRILARHKVSVAPFKPQNMALNSAVTKEGGEIGRAQAAQAEACYLDASVEMNPVLLKPNSDVGAQVIVNGHAIGNMDARTYHEYKPELLGRVVKCYESLRSKYDVVIVEGAGSPAEINLREHDIANMGFAEAVDCPVIIIADIDRGGVFAHIYGTYELLSASEQQRVKGFVINRFRGDISLLTSGLDWLEEKTGVPVLGVVPYLRDLHIEAEDALNITQVTAQNADDTTQEKLKVVVPIYPRASNHTDFDVLRLHPHIDCQFMRDAREFKGADLIVLPGSKSVRADLQSLKDAGWESVIQRHLRYGGKLIGICGGFQMLGEHIHDPEGIESNAGSSKGLGLINMETMLTPHKTLKRVEGEFVNNCAGKNSSDIPPTDEKTKVSGYEIHAGTSQGEGLASPLFSLTDEQSVNAVNEGARNVDDSVWGSYLHGLFDESGFLTKTLQWAGSHLEHYSDVTDNVSNYNYAKFRDEQFNRLANAVEEAISFDTLRTIILDERVNV